MLRKFYINTTILIILNFWVGSSIAQEIPVYYHSQYLLNPYLINPAIAGSKDYSRLNLSVRQITAKIAGAPKTQILSYQTRLRKFLNLNQGTIKKGSEFSNVGVGGYVFNDASGPLRKIGFQLTYAYHLALSRESIQHLSFGISFTGFTYSINYGELNIIRDPLINEGTQRAFVPDANFGVYYYGKQLFGGISVTQIFQTPIKWSNDQFEQIPIKRNYFLFAGYKFLLMNKIIIEPSLLYKSESMPVPTNYINPEDTEPANGNEIHNQVDINLRVYYQTIIGGLSYRLNEGLTVWGQYQYRNLFFGLAYEYPMSEVWNVSFGSINVVLGINLGRGRNRFGDRRYW